MPINTAKAILQGCQDFGKLDSHFLLYSPASFGNEPITGGYLHYYVTKCMHMAMAYYIKYHSGWNLIILYVFKFNL